jgi:hypothetical protein
MIVGVNVDASWLTNAATMMNCRIGYISFIYLNIFIRGNIRRRSFWLPLFDSNSLSLRFNMFAVSIK